MNDPGRTVFREIGRLSASPATVTGSGSLFPRGVLAVLSGIIALLLATVSPVAAVGFLLAVLVLATTASAVEIVQAYERRALTVFGEYRGLLDPGFHLVPPFVSRTYRFDLRTVTIDVPRQEAITRDNSPVTADAIVYVRVVDAKRAFLEVDDYRNATAMLARTTLRAVLGDMDLDHTLSRRDEINTRIREGLQGPTDEWGVEVEMVEVREVLPTAGVRSAMEEQSSAERRRRAAILEAQGERRAAVESAEGERASNVLTAQGEKRASVLQAQGDSIATVLRATAAEAMGERAIVDRGLDTLVEVGQGDSSTFVLPQELTSTLGRYGRRLSGSDVSVGDGLEGRDFDDEERELLGLDDIEAIVGNGEGEEVQGLEDGDTADGM